MDSVTSYNFRPINQTKWGPKADFVPLSKMGDWKYNLLIDGTVAAYRAPYLFQHETLVLKQASGTVKPEFRSRTVDVDIRPLAILSLAIVHYTFFRILRMVVQVDETRSSLCPTQKRFIKSYGNDKMGV